MAIFLYPLNLGLKTTGLRVKMSNTSCICICRVSFLRVRHLTSRTLINRVIWQIHLICKAVRDMTEMKVLISGKFDNQGSTTNENHRNLLCSSGCAYLYSKIQYLVCFLSAGWQWILNLKLTPSICYLSSWKNGKCWKSDCREITPTLCSLSATVPN